MADDLINQLAEGGTLERRKPPPRQDRMEPLQLVVIYGLAGLAVLALASAWWGL